MGYIITAIGSLVGFLAKYFSKSAIKLGIQYVSMTAFVAAVIGFYAFLISSLITIYNLINNVLDEIQGLANSSGSGFCLGEAISAVLTCFGVIDGFNASKAVLLSALTFVISFIFWRIAISAKKQLQDTINKALRLI